MEVSFLHEKSALWYSLHVPVCRIFVRAEFLYSKTFPREGWTRQALNSVHQTMLGRLHVAWNPISCFCSIFSFSVYSVPAVIYHPLTPYFMTWAAMKIYHTQKYSRNLSGTWASFKIYCTYRLGFLTCKMSCGASFWLMHDINDAHVPERFYEYFCVWQFVIK